MSNIVFLNEMDLDRKVYRIISVERLIELFQNKTNVLVKPELWEDPFENFILNSKVKLASGEVADLGMRNDFFGQCWTLHKSSDAMWRIYSPEKNSVRIRTTIRKLITSLDNQLGKWAHIQSFVGKVKYLPNKKLKKFANNVFKGPGLPQPTQFAKTLLVKRPAFLHENEVRLLYCESKNNVKNKLYGYSIDPHALVEQIMIDPRLVNQDVVAMKRQILSLTRFKGPIKRSLLYASPNGMVFPFG